LGLPTSSSHALIGGYGGAAIAAYGSFFGILKPEGWIKTSVFIVASPMIGLILGWTFMIAVHWIFMRSTPRRVDKFFRKGQLFSAAAYSIGHGDRKSTRLNSSHVKISYAVFCLKKKRNKINIY